jgi:hypothetical protein
MTRDKDTHKKFIVWYNEEFGFTANSATALHDVQMLKTPSTLSELDDNAVANICKAISKDTGQTVAKVATTKVKVACFWIKHQHRTSRKIGGTSKPLVKVKYKGTIDLLQQQKQEEDNWTSGNEEPKNTPLTLDTATATNVFDKVRNTLARVRGVTGAPLIYIIRVMIIPEDKNSDPPFGDKDTKYTSVDMETTAHTPILSNNANYKEEFETLKAYGPFVPSFLPEDKKVWSILFACFGLSSMWQHIKKFATQQNGVKPCIPSTIIFWGETRSTPWSLTFF